MLAASCLSSVLLPLSLLPINAASPHRGRIGSTKQSILSFSSFKSSESENDVFGLGLFALLLIVKLLFIRKKIDYSSIPDCLFEMQNYSLKQLISKCFFGWWGVKVFAIGM
jgi:hypothetical protein